MGTLRAKKARGKARAKAKAKARAKSRAEAGAVVDAGAAAAAADAAAVADAAAAAPKAKKSRPDNLYLTWGGWQFKCIIAKGEFSAISAECKCHFDGTTNDCARSLGFEHKGECLEEDVVALRLNKWLVLGLGVQRCDRDGHMAAKLAPKKLVAVWGASDLERAKAHRWLSDIDGAEQRFSEVELSELRIADILISQLGLCFSAFIYF